MADDGSRNLLAVFGLGNPGKKHQGTRHNVGFEVIDRLAQEYGVTVSRRRFSALIGEAQSEAGKLLLVKPQTYMNDSGLAVQAVVAWHELAVEQTLVVCDDLDLELGSIRIRRAGSSGGHRGLLSIAAALGTSRFPRLRIGIGRPEPQDAIDYVLDPFARTQRKVMADAFERAAEAVQSWAAEGIEHCMNKFNRKDE